MSRRLLLTPGPLTTADATRAAMARDWGSRDKDFIALTASIRDRLNAICDGGENHTAVLLQGSGTFVVEAMLGTFVGPNDKVLILENGAYGRRASDICHRIGRQHVALSWPEDTPVEVTSIAKILAEDKEITHVLAVQVETTSGVLNPLQAISDATAAAGRKLLIDAMSAFGALPLSAGAITFDAVAASSNKCLEGVPGLGFVVANTESLKAAKGNAPSLSLDLHDQWQGFENNGQWRFTPPTQVIAAFAAALDAFEAEGGVTGRGRRYAENCRILCDGLINLGLKLYLKREEQAPIIVTFCEPNHPNYSFDTFYDELAQKGLVIYPGKLTAAPSFRIGCIGDLRAPDMERVVAEVGATLTEMGVTFEPA